MPPVGKMIRLKMVRENDDFLHSEGNEPVKVLRASIGGNDHIGYYLTFRGEPEEIVDMLEMMAQAAKQQLPRGRYLDKRTEQ